MIFICSFNYPVHLLLHTSFSSWTSFGLPFQELTTLDTIPSERLEQRIICVLALRKVNRALAIKTIITCLSQQTVHLQAPTMGWDFEVLRVIRTQNKEIVLEAWQL